MGVIETRTFKSGNSVAVRLPKELGFEAGTLVAIEKTAGQLTIKPARDTAEANEKLRTLAAKLESIWANAPDREIGRRETFDIPERFGL